MIGQKQEWYIHIFFSSLSTKYKYCHLNVHQKTQSWAQRNRVVIIIVFLTHMQDWAHTHTHTERTAGEVGLEAKDTRTYTWIHTDNCLDKQMTFSRTPPMSDVIWTIFTHMNGYTCVKNVFYYFRTLRHTHTVNTVHLYEINISTPRWVCLPATTTVTVGLTARFNRW